MLKTQGKRKWLLTLLALVSAISLLAGACGGDDDDEAGTATPAPSPTQTGGIDYSKLSGTVNIDGSSTVYPITKAVAEDFSKIAGNVRANVALSGTGGGFEKFCRKEIQISDASRPINQAEKDKCAAAGIATTDLVEIQVAIDALTLVVHPQNTWAQCMKTAEIQTLFKADGATKWKDINPAWPDETVKFFVPGADSGTFDYFKEAIKLRGTASSEPAHKSPGGNVTVSEDDNILVKGVEGSKYAIGYFGFAYYEEAGKNLKALEVDGGSGCVAPSFDNALQAKYKPLSRPLFIYTTQTILKERPEVVGFTKFYIDNMIDLSKEVGYISLPDALQKQQADKLTAFLPK